MKVYVHTVLETGQLTSTDEVYDSFEKSKKSLFELADKFPYMNRSIRETEYKNRFEIIDENGDLVHTIEIVDLWVR